MSLLAQELRVREEPDGRWGGLPQTLDDAHRCMHGREGLGGACYLPLTESFPDDLLPVSHSRYSAVLRMSWCSSANSWSATGSSGQWGQLFCESLQALREPLVAEDVFAWGLISY